MDLEFQLDQKDTVEKVLAAIGMRHDQKLMHESISYIDVCIHLRSEEYIHTIMVSKELEMYCYYE